MPIQYQPSNAYIVCSREQLLRKSRPLSPPLSLISPLLRLSLEGILGRGDGPDVPELDILLHLGHDHDLALAGS